MLACRRKTTALVLVRERAGEVRCRHCGGANDIERLWSRFASPKSEDARLESLADPSALARIDENDPRSVAKFMKRMGSEMGEDVGEDVKQAIEEEMAGKSEPGGADGERSPGADPDAAPGPPLPFSGDDDY